MRGYTSRTSIIGFEPLGLDAVLAIALAPPWDFSGDGLVK
jgi:hypothetical protein